MTPQEALNLKNQLTEIAGSLNDANAIYKLNNILQDLTAQAAPQQATNRNRSYGDICNYTHSFYSFLTTSRNGLGIINNSHVNENLGVFMEKNCVESLMYHIPSNGYLVALPGKTGSQFTISLLGADINCNFLPGHKNGTIPGQETWQVNKKYSNLCQLF